MKQCPILQQAQDVGPVAGTLLGKATPAYLPDHVLFWGIQWSVEKTCWNGIRRWSVDIKPDETGVTVDTYPMAGVDLDTCFPKALALLRHMEIKETGRREFCPEGIAVLLFYLVPVHEATHLWNQQHSRRTPISVDTIASTARTYTSHLLCKWWTFWVQE